MNLSQIPALKLFLLLVMMSLMFAFVDIGRTEIIIIACISIAFMVLCVFKEKYSAAYFVCIIGISALLSQRIDYFTNNYPSKIIPSQKAIFNGQIKDILKSNGKYLRYTAYGNINSPDLPLIKETGILLTVFNPKFALLPGDNFIADVEVDFSSADMPGSNFSLKKYMKAIEVDWSAVTSGNAIFKKDESNPLISTSFIIRRNIQKRLYRLFDTNSAAVVSALLTGDKSMINPEINQNFILSGTAHILAISGSNVGLFAFLIFTLLSFIKNNWIKTILSLIIIFLLVYITGFQTSVNRAALMVAVFIISSNLEKRVNPLNSIGLSALILFIINPDIIFSVAFQLSFLSVFGILTLYQIILTKFNQINKKSKFGNVVLSSFALTLSSSILISPLVAYYFGLFSIVSPITNLIVVPLMVLALSFGLAALLFSYISFGFAELYSASSSFMINLSDSINGFAINFEWSYISGNISIWIAIFVSCLLLYIIYSVTNRNLVFRLSISVFLFYFALLNVPENKSESIVVVPKQNLTAVILNKNIQNEYLLLFDRKAKNKTRKDFDISKYILNNEKIKSIAITGNSGIATIDAVKNEKKINYYELDLSQQNRIISLLNLSENPVKQIEYYND
jgi:competence protein ComEC